MLKVILLNKNKFFLKKFQTLKFISVFFKILWVVEQLISLVLLKKYDLNVTNYKFKRSICYLKHLMDLLITNVKLKDLCIHFP
jgi:hypothetical protein